MKFRNDDTFLVSYPKSGNTWLRFLLANLIARPPESFRDANRLVPDIHNAHTPDILESVPSPRIIKSHYPFDPQYKKVIYLVRDPRSVSLSQYFFKMRRGEISSDVGFESFLEKFLDGFDDGYSNWGDNVTSWLQTERGDGSLFVIRYEALRRNTFSELKRICEFGGIHFSDQKIEQAIANSSMEAMRKMERETGLGNQLRGKGDLSIPFVRKGSTTEWRDYFSESMETRLRNRFSDAMRLAGYT